MLLWWCPLILSFESFLIHGGKKHRVSPFELSSKLFPATAVGGVKSSGSAISLFCFSSSTEG